MKKFFAAANTEHGFRSLFDEVFTPDAFRRIYILKGGPGTGKSTLMSEIGSVAQAKGYDVEYICCSSDPDSLDGIVISELAVAFLDGTSPHTTDPIYPGAVERIVDLGNAFDFDLLEKKKHELIPMIRAKKEAYRAAYRFLSAMGKMEKEQDETLRQMYLEEKAHAAVGRLIASFQNAVKGGERKRYISSICEAGYHRLDTLHGQAKKIYAVTDKNGTGYLFMNTLYQRLHREGFSMTICPCPVTEERTEAIFLRGEEILFVISKDETETASADKIINSLRFVDQAKLASVKNRLRFAGKCRAFIREGAVSCFAEASAWHAKTEKIYGACVNFSEIDRMTGKIIDEIFANNV